MNYQFDRLTKPVFFAAALSVAGMFPAKASAEEITLRSSDGSVNVMGEFLEFTDGNYVIRSDLGDLTISAVGMTCEGAACPDAGRAPVASGEIKIVGSDDIGVGLMPLLMGGYSTYLDALIEFGDTGSDLEMQVNFVADQGYGDPIGGYHVTSKSSGDGFKALLDGSADIAMSVRRVTPDEARALRDAGAGNMISPKQEHIIAVDTKLVLVHPSSPLSSVTVDNLARIFSGEITNWSEVGGPDLPILVVIHGEDTHGTDTGTMSVVQIRVFGGRIPPLPPNYVTAENSDIASDMVAADAGAIAMVGHAFQRGSKVLNLVNYCGLEMVADSFSAKTEEYLLERRFYLYHRADVKGDLIDKFIQYATSEAADEVIAQSGFVDLGVEVRSQAMESPRAKQLLDAEVPDFEANVMREMLAEMTKLDRVSTTFRFRTGSSALDERAILDLERLTKFLEAKPEGTVVAFVGFSDDVGEFDPNRQLSKGRAEQVMAEVQKHAGGRLPHITFAANGFGEISPVACNDGEVGRAINRRVEVWISKA